MPQVNLSWDADGNIQSYSVFRSQEPMDVNNLPIPIAENITNKSFSDTTIVSGEIYYYRVASIVGEYKKISAEIEVKTNIPAALTYVSNSSRNAASVGGATSLSVDIAPYLAGDIILLFIRSFTSNVSAPGFNELHNSNPGFKLLSRIANTSSATQTSINITMGFGGAASFILRPSRSIATVYCDAALSSYKSAAVANDTIVRVLQTPSTANDKVEIFEIDAVQWASVYGTTKPITSISSDQQIIATTTNPSNVGNGFNFVLAGKKRSNSSTLAGAVFGVSSIPNYEQNITGLTAAIYAI